MRPKPSCSFCGDPAKYLAAQSTNAGKTIKWVYACKAHMWRWNEGSDWEAPVYQMIDKTREHPKT